MTLQGNRSHSHVKGRNTFCNLLKLIKYH